MWPFYKKKPPEELIYTKTELESVYVLLIQDIRGAYHVYVYNSAEDAITSQQALLNTKPYSTSRIIRTPVINHSTSESVFKEL